MIERIWGKLVSKNEQKRGEKPIKLLEIDVGSQYPTKIVDWQYGDKEYISDVCEIGQEMFFEFDERDGKINEKTGKPYKNRNIKKIYPKDSIPDDSWNESQKHMKAVEVPEMNNLQINNREGVKLVETDKFTGVEEALLDINTLIAKYHDENTDRIKSIENLSAKSYDEFSEKLNSLIEQMAIMGNRINKIMEHLEIKEDKYASAVEIYSKT